MTLADWIKAQETSGAAVAAALGVSAAAVSYWCNGRPIARGYVPALVRALGLSDGDLAAFLRDIGHPAAELGADGAALLDIATRAGSPPPVDPKQAAA